MADDGKDTIVECMAQPPMINNQKIDPLLFPLMMPFMILNSLMSALANSMSMMQGNPFMGMPGMSNTSSNSVVNLSYDEKGNIASIYERKW